MLLENPFQRVTVKVLIVGDHVDNARQVGKQVALVPIRKDCRYGGIVKFYVFVVNFNKMYFGMRSD